MHARLVTALNSSTAKKGDSVEALITEPLVVSDRLILPEGSAIKGSVIEVQSARRLGRNGQLRILFQWVAPQERAGAEGRDESGRRSCSKGRAPEAGRGGWSPSDHAADAVFDDGHRSDAGRDPGSPGSRCGTRESQRREKREVARRAERGITICGNDCGIGGAFARSVGGIRFVWSGDVDLLPLSGARTRCGLSERHGHGDWARNSRHQVHECRRTIGALRSTSSRSSVNTYLYAAFDGLVKAISSHSWTSELNISNSTLRNT